MHHLEWIARDRIDKFNEQLSLIEKAEFMPPSTSLALYAIRAEVIKLEHTLQTSSNLSNSQFLRNYLVSISQKVFNLTNYLGILLRSTNLRNCFEVYFAFEEMTFALIGERQRLILTSEWDTVPFYIPSPPAALDRFVIIGIPAFASRNALFLPLATHELGHAIWRYAKLDDVYVKMADEKLKAISRGNNESFKKDFSLGDSPDLFDLERIESECIKLVSSQCQEMFCDLLGATIFGESYVYAFDAFLAPGFGTREPSYPSFADRADSILHASGLKRSDLRPGVLESDARTAPIIRDPLVRYADKLTRELGESVFERAKGFAERLPYDRAYGENKEAMLTSLRNKIPPDNPRSPVEILNAVWQVYFEEIDKIREDERKHFLEMMNNICLKSLEVYEWRQVERYGGEYARFSTDRRGAEKG